jgi:hypothetical protein
LKAPPQVITELRAFRAAGVDFDCIYVLHELPSEWTPGTPPPAMELVGTENDAGAKVVKAQEVTFRIGLDALRMAVKAAGVAVRGAAVAGAAVGAAAGEALAFDPVLLGGVRSPESDEIAWFVLGQWDERPAE